MSNVNVSIPFGYQRRSRKAFRRCLETESDSADAFALIKDDIPVIIFAFSPKISNIQ